MKDWGEVMSKEEKRLRREYKQLTEAIQNDFVDVSLSTFAYRERRLREIEEEAEKRGFTLEQ